MKKKVDEAQTVLMNILEFLDVVAFAIVALFAVYHGLTHRTDSKWYYILAGAGLVVSLKAFLLLVKHFSKK